MKKENDLTVVNTLIADDNIRAILTDGSSVITPFNSLPIADKNNNGLLSSKQLMDISKSMKGLGKISGEETDDKKESGIYSVSSSVLSAKGKWGILVVFNSSFYILQLLIGPAGAAFRIMLSQYDKWSEWSHFVLS